jgi:hypothetical protein
MKAKYVNKKAYIRDGRPRTQIPIQRDPTEKWLKTTVQVLFFNIYI